MNPPTPNPLRRHIYRVSELNQTIKRLLEEKFPFVWISGEMSNLRIPSSGHCYFTLKDDRSQLSAVMFRGQAAALRFKPDDGLSVVGLGRVSVYEPRGSYQVIFEYLEPMGIGGLQIAFDKLKRALADEGLFDVRHKKPLPSLPGKISIVTSPTGAAVRDFIHVSQRRFSNLPLEVVPVSVQGVHAAMEIIQAIRTINSMNRSDVIVLARGGGSIEDLAAFNDEGVARSIFASDIPVVSAVGHETDFTIADFVADLRAATPSAGAEIVVPSKNELEQRIDEVNLGLKKSLTNILKNNKIKLYNLRDRIVHPRRRLQDMQHRLDQYVSRLAAITMNLVMHRKERAAYGRAALMRGSPGNTVRMRKEQIQAWRRSIVGAMQRKINDGHGVVGAEVSMLDALNPLAILQRGYSVTRSLPGLAIVRSARQVKIEQNLEILLGSGRLMVTIDERKT